MLKEHFMDYESHTVTQPALEKKLEILDKNRENEIISRLAKKFKMLKKEHIKSIFNQIFNVSRLIQKEKK